MLSPDEQKLRAIRAWAKTRKRVAGELYERAVSRTGRSRTQNLGRTPACPSPKRM